nr:hypothetical protein [Tanacetum cinerariifolium]
MTNVEQGREYQQNASHELGFVQEEEDAHVTLITVHDKTEGPLQSSSISYDFTIKLLNLNDLSSNINSLMNTLTVPPPPPPMNVDYVALLWEDFMNQADNKEISTLKFVSKTKDYQKYGALIPDGMINQDIMLSTAYKTYLDYATGKVPPNKARKFKKLASPKLKIVPASPKEPTQKGKQVKRAAKKATTASTTSVVIRDTPEDSLDSNDDSLGDSEDESDDVHDEDGYDDESGNDDDGSSDAEDSEQTEDTYMTNVEQGREYQQNASHELGFVQEEEDAHVTLITVHDKTEGPLQSSSISYDFTIKLLNLNDLSSNINSLMNTLTVPPPPPPVNPSSHPTTIPWQQTPDSTTTTYPI